MPKINIYPNGYTVDTNDTIDLIMFLENIRDGEYHKQVKRIREEPDEDKQQALKKKLPVVTLSGLFSEKKDAALIEHSGFMAVDIDKLKGTAEELRDSLKADRYIFSCFLSTRANGVCAIVKIDPNKHRDAYRGFAKHLYDTHGVLVDPSCVNESRGRFASWDPHLWINQESLTFKKYPPKEKKKQPLPQFVRVDSDFEVMISALGPYNICEDYGIWHRVGNALYSGYQEQGRAYFHELSKHASTYDYETCDKQYDLIKKYQGSSSKEATIGTIYYYAKQYNIPFYSERTREIIKSTSLLKKSGLQVQAIVENLQKFSDIPASESEKIVAAAYTAGLDLKDEDSVINDIEKWLKFNYELRFNAVKKKVYIGENELTDRAFNNVWVRCKKVFANDVNTELLDKLIHSDMSTEFNPLLDFFERYKDRQPVGVIQELFECIETDTGVGAGEFYPDYAYEFGRKWLVSLVAAAHGQISPLMLVLCGKKQGTGKTTFFRQLLPPELRADYFDNFRLDADKDTFIKMCTYWLLLDDEMGGRSHREAVEFKTLSSRDKMSLRRSYGRFAESMRRLAVLAGTTNDPEIIYEDENRRIIPINVLGIDWARYNAVDKVDLFMEAYHLYKAGFQWEILGNSKTLLEQNTGKFKQTDTEIEALLKCYRVPNKTDLNHTYRTTTDIFNRVSVVYPGLRMTIKRIGQAIQRAGFEQSTQRVEGYAHPVKCYRVIDL